MTVPKPSASSIAGRPVPTNLRPMLARPTVEAFDSPDHIYEVSWGGVRMIVVSDGGTFRMHGRNLADLGSRFPEFEAIIPRQLRKPGVALDGEIVALDSESHPDVRLLRPRLGPEPSLEGAQFVFQAMDLLYVQGKPLLSTPLLERKRLLARVLAAGDLAQPAEFVEKSGVAFYQAAVDHRLPGILAKDRGSLYFPGRRSHDWREIRVHHASEVVIGGCTIAAGGRHSRLEGLLVGVVDRHGLRYAGQVTGPFDEAEAAAMERMLQPLVTPQSPFREPPSVSRLVYWCRPELCAEVYHTGWDAKGKLRFPLLATLRPELSPRDCEAPPRSRAAS